MIASAFLVPRKIAHPRLEYLFNGKYGCTISVFLQGVSSAYYVLRFRRVDVTLPVVLVSILNKTSSAARFSLK